MKKLIINGYEITYNPFWGKWDMWHDEIGYIGQYRRRSDAYIDAKKG